MQEPISVFERHSGLIKLLKRLGIQVPDNLSSNTFPISGLAKRGLINENDVIKLVADTLSIRLAEIRKKDVYILLDSSPYSQISLLSWRDMRAIPLKDSGTFTIVCLADPLDHETISALEFVLSKRVEVEIGSEDIILSVLESKINASETDDKFEELKESAEESDNPESNAFERNPTAPPIVRLVNKILSQAFDLNSSDIHLTPGADDLGVDVRVDGLLRPLIKVPKRLHASVLSRIKLLAGMDIAEKRRPQDGRFRINSTFGVKDLRVSTLTTAHGENMVIRVLSNDEVLLNLKALSMPEIIEWKWREELKRTSRILLVTGPTGSGKSTTLYSSIKLLIDGSHNIMTVEDPIEYRISGIRQTQKNAKTGLGFAEALKSILRQDPDIIMIGEIRDRETATIAHQSALTGHLVLSTLHTNSAASAITRLIDIGVPAHLIASSLGAVLAQRLVRRLCSHCKIEQDPAELPSILKSGYKEVGCEACSNTGFIGRLGLYSFLEITEDIRKAIKDNSNEKEIEELSGKNGFISLWDSALELISKGEISFNEATRVLGPYIHEAPSVKNRSSMITNAFAHEACCDLRKRRILLAEDNNDTREMLTMLLRSQLYEVTEAIDGIDALEKIFKQLPDLIITDLMMPRMDGLDLIKRLRQEKATSTLPILLLTTAVQEENEINALGIGASDFVSKLSSSKIMLARIQKLLET